MVIKMTKYLQYGLSMIEVLVTIVILSFGLLGLAGLQSRLQLSDLEGYQRAQGLILLDDMTNKIAVNRNNAASYVTGTTATGTGVTCPTSTATRKDADIKDWCNALQGASEASGSKNVGAFIGGRGCISDLGSGEYMVTVAWQGMGAITAPAASVACGQNAYNNSTTCTNDRCRRVLTSIVRIATL